MISQRQARQNRFLAGLKAIEDEHNLKVAEMNAKLATLEAEAARLRAQLATLRDADAEQR